MHGGLKIYRGSAAAARNYVEADRSRADDYYLAEGSGLAQRLVAGPSFVQRREDMDGPTYERWVAGHDVETGAAKGRLRTDDQAVRFAEVTVNGPKTWSIAAALHPEIAEAYDAAQDRAAAEIVGWLAQHATTRVGPRGRQVQVPVEQIEAAVVRHFTSRAGDPHRHLHLQINARVWAAGTWRGLHTVGVRDSLEAINGIGHASVMTDPRFRAALADHGYSLDDEGGEIVELKAYVGAFSARARQIETNIDRYEATWRAEHPGEEPGPTLRRTWDRHAWAEARPDKVVPVTGDDLCKRWSDELGDLGFVAPLRQRQVPAVRPGELDRGAVVEKVLSRLGSRRSAWNGADARGEVERLIASAGVVVDGAAAGTGMRQGEIFGLTRNRLRLLGANPVVVVDRQLLTRLNRVTEFGPLKTRASYRTIPLPATVVDALNGHLAARDIGDDDLIFTLEGRPITRQAFGHVWRPVAKVAGLNQATGPGMHALRHYYASLLIRYGESVKTVQARLGHASASETLDTYSHLWPDSDDRTREAIDSVLGAGQGSGIQVPGA